MLRRVLKIAGAILAAVAVLALGAIAVFVLTFEPNDYRELIEDRISAALGREVRLAGDIELVPAMVPTLAVNDVSIGNPPWASRPTMATAGRLEANVALRPLLDGRVEISHAALERVDVLLERGEDDRGNWDFELAAAAAADSSPGPGIETSIDRIELNDIAVRYVEADGTDVTTHVDAMTLDRSEAGRITIRVSGGVQSLPVVAEWLAGPVDDAAGSTELRWPVTATISLGETTATMTGRLAAPMAYLQSEFDLRVVGRNVTELFELAGMSPVADVEYDIAGRVRIGPDSVQVADLHGSLTGEEVFQATRIATGDMQLVRGQRIEASLAGTESDIPFSVSTRLGLLRDILSASTSWPLDAELTLGEAAVSATGTVGFGAGSPRADLSLRARGPVLESLNRIRPFELPDAGPLSLETMLVARPDRISLNQLRLSVAGSEIEGDLAVTGLPATPAVNGNLVASSLDIGVFASADGPGGTGSQTGAADREIPLNWLGTVSGSLNLMLGELRGLPVPLTEAALRMDLADGRLEITDASVRVAEIELRATGSLARTAGTPEVALEILAPSLDSAVLMQAFGVAAVPSLTWAAGPAEIRIDALGSSVRELVDASRIALTMDTAAIGFSSDDRSADVVVAGLSVEAEPGMPVGLVANGKLTAAAFGRSIDTPFELALTGGSLSQLINEKRLWPAIELTVNGATYLDQPLQIQTRVTDTAALISGAPAPVLLNASWGSLAAGIDATLVTTASLEGTTGDISLTTEDLVATAGLIGVQGLPAGSATISGRVLIAPNSIELGDVAATFPGIDASGQLSVGRAEGLEASADLHFATLDLTPYVAPQESQPTQSTEVQWLALYELLSDDPIGLPRLREAGVSADLRASVDEFRLGSFVSRTATAQMSLERGDVEMEISLDAGRVTASAEIDARAEDVDVHLKLAGDDVPLAVDQTAARAADTAVMAFNATLAGRGASTRAIAESLDGDIEIYLAQGRIRAAGMRFLFGSVLFQVFDAINPFTQRQDYLEIECVGAYFDVDAGVLTTRNGIIMQTPELQAVGVGSLHLADNALQMQFRTKRRKGIVPSIGGVVNEFIEVQGTLDEPRIGVATRRAARSGLVAVVTGGLSLIATDVFGRLTSGEVCVDLPALVSELETDN